MSAATAGQPARLSMARAHRPLATRVRTRPPTLLIANPSGDVYGSDLQMLQTISAMRTRGWRIVVALPASGPLVPRLVEHGAEVRFVPFPVVRRANASARGMAALAADAGRALPRIRRFLAQLAPDAVYVNTVTIPWWLAVARACRIPAVCHVHEAETDDPKPVRLALNLPLLAANSLIAISRPSFASISQDVPWLARKTRLIYNGVPEPGHGIEPVDASAPFRLAVIGRLSPRKAPDVALEAVAILRRAGRDVRLEVCGTPYAGYDWYERKLRLRAAQDDLEGAVDFSGYVSPVWPALERAHALLAPSTREALGNVVIEAQLAGRPVVATATTGHLETVLDGETGLLVPPGDAEAMAAAAGRLIDEPLFASQLAERAALRAAERFSVERYGDEIAALIESLGFVPPKEDSDDE